MQTLSRDMKDILSRWNAPNAYWSAPLGRRRERKREREREREREIMSPKRRFAVVVDLGYNGDPDEGLCQTTSTLESVSRTSGRSQKTNSHCLNPLMWLKSNTLCFHDQCWMIKILIKRSVDRTILKVEKFYILITDYQIIMIFDLF